MLGQIGRRCEGVVMAGGGDGRSSTV